VRYYLENWEEECRNGIVKKIGLEDKPKPSCRKAHFVQLDEFFPMDPTHERSFRYYVKRYYLDGFGFDPERALLLDTFHVDAKRNPALAHVSNLEDLFQGGSFACLDLRERQPSNPREALQREVIEYFDRVCEEYERKIRSLGGIGFFLGGIGPDGHIAFNVKGSSHHSSTRLTLMNYETMASAAQDLGGIEAVRKKAVITIGLETITYNPQAVAIIMAAGEAKAKVVAQAVEEAPDILAPASSLQSLRNARFYLTRGAAARLKERRFKSLKESAGPLSVNAGPGLESEIQKLVIDGSLIRQAELKHAGFYRAKGRPEDGNPVQWEVACALADKSLVALAQETSDSLMAKIQLGLRLSGAGSGEQRFLHTAPHHDDIELAYFPLLHHLVRSERNANHFCYLTSGFTSVTNHYLLQPLKALRNSLSDGTLFQKMSAEELRKEDTRYKEIYGYLNAIADRDETDQILFTACRLYRYFFKHLESSTPPKILASVEEQIQLMENLPPGKREPSLLQNLKGWLREWEAELVWAHSRRRGMCILFCSRSARLTLLKVWH
jgi:glucosamine-6-phosphate deaminase